MPVYNAETFISPCLDSLLLINVKKEIIVIDDGSTDNTPNILANYIRQYPDIKYHYQPNQGVSAARNRGIGLAQGRFIQFVDADDYLIYTHYAAILSVLDHFQLDLIQWLHIEEDHSQNPPYKYAVPLHFPANKPAVGLIVNSEEVISQLITEQHRITCWSGLYRKSYLDRYRIRFEEGISACEDNIFMVDTLLLQSSLLLYFPQFVYCYRRHNESCTQRPNNARAFQQIFAACEKLKQRESLLLSNENKRRLLQDMQNKMYLYAYTHFYRHFDDTLKIQMKSCFTEEIIARLRQKGETVWL